ncbi:cell envelope integrity protein TolA [Providencia stuartii]
MYNAGTVTTTANSTKLIGTNTKWKDNNSRVSAEQVILIQNGSTIYINSIASIQSNTEITLSFPVPASVSNAPYQILTTMVNSVSDAANKIVAMNVSNVQFSDILNRWATESGTITVTLPDGTTQQLRTAKEMDKQLDGKVDKTGGTISSHITVEGNIQSNTGKITANLASATGIQLDGTGEIAKIRGRAKDGRWYDHIIPEVTGTLMQAGDYGLGFSKTPTDLSAKENGFFNSQQFSSVTPTDAYFGFCAYNTSKSHGFLLGARRKDIIAKTYENNVVSEYSLYHTANTTKDSNGNLKAASPIVKVFADHIELNEESEGVEMEHLGVGHYLIKGVVGFNADGAWGINNGFVIPQDHNGKNMVLIDYDVKPDGNIELFVFHNQNIDMPERFQNKRIKHFDEDGNPVYYENYEPCDVPESRWIDMRVEMPVNSIYNLKQAEAERLAKEEADRQAEEEAKNAEIEAEEDI